MRKQRSTKIRGQRVAQRRKLCSDSKASISQEFEALFDKRCFRIRIWFDACENDKRQVMDEVVLRVVVHLLLRIVIQPFRQLVSISMRRLASQFPVNGEPRVWLRHICRLQQP